VLHDTVKFAQQILMQTLVPNLTKIHFVVSEMKCAGGQTCLS